MTIMTKKTKVKATESLWHHNLRHKAWDEKGIGITGIQKKFWWITHTYCLGSLLPKHKHYLVHMGLVISTQTAFFCQCFIFMNLLGRTQRWFLKSVDGWEAYMWHFRKVIGGLLNKHTSLGSFRRAWKRFHNQPIVFYVGVDLIKSITSKKHFSRAAFGGK